MFLSLINPYIYGNETDVPVNSSILHVHLELCSDTNTSTSPVSITNDFEEAAAPLKGIVIPKHESEINLISNMTANHSTGLLFHPFHIGKEVFTVQFQLYPVWPEDSFQVRSP